MNRLTHGTDPGCRPGSGTRRILAGLGQRVRVASIRGGLGTLDPARCPPPSTRG